MRRPSGAGDGRQLNGFEPVGDLRVDFAGGGCLSSRGCKMDDSHLAVGSESEREEIEPLVFHHPRRVPQLELADAQILDVFQSDHDFGLPRADELELVSVERQFAFALENVRLRAGKTFAHPFRRGEVTGGLQLGCRVNGFCPRLRAGWDLA